MPKTADEKAEQLLAAADLLADAIRAGRLPKKPPMETLARIAGIITTSRRSVKKHTRKQAA
jgi:hypothetical protein